MIAAKHNRITYILKAEHWERRKPYGTLTVLAISCAPAWLRTRYLNLKGFAAAVTVPVVPRELLNGADCFGGSTLWASL
jgi:hypothetical protein